MRFSTRKLIPSIFLVLMICVVVSGCKAQSTLTVQVQDKASGYVNLEIELDEQAASAIRSDAYDAQSLANIFNAKKLKKAGFKVKISDNSNGDPSLIQIKANFQNEKDLKAIFSVLAPPKVLDVSLKVDYSLVKQDQKTNISVDLSTLRDFYLNDQGVKDAIEQAGIEPSEFETLVDSALQATTLVVELNQGGKTPNETIDGSELRKAQVSAQTSSFRAQYFFYMVGATVCFLFAIFLIWRICRMPRLLSKKSTLKQREELSNLRSSDNQSESTNE